ncbi:hypothetical protein GCM10009534_67660 [Kribbella sandramycini]
MQPAAELGFERAEPLGQPMAEFVGLGTGSGHRRPFGVLGGGYLLKRNLRNRRFIPHKDEM